MSMNTTLTVRSPLAPLLLQEYATRGGDLDALVSDFGLAPGAEQQRDLELNIPALHRLCDVVVAFTGDEFIGLHLAARSERGAYGMLEVMGSYSRNLRDGFERLTKYVRLVNPTASVSLEEDGPRVRVVHRMRGGTPFLGRQGHEYMLAVMVKNTRATTVGDFPVRQVFFAHPRPSQVEPLERYFQTSELVFDSAFNGISFPAQLLDQPMRAFDPALMPVLEEQVVRMLDSEPDDLLARTRRSVRIALGTGDVTLATVARQLAVSERTLQRRLVELGTRFQDVVDEVRRDEAITFMKNPQHGLAEIAFRLGYSELRAFLRAFRRWTGTTPGQFRVLRAR